MRSRGRFFDTKLTTEDDNVNKLKNFINNLEISNNFDIDFKSFRQMLSNILIHYPNKKNIFNRLQEHLQGMRLSSETMQQLSRYINRCIERMNEPLPEALDEQYIRFQITYGMEYATAFQKQKLDFQKQKLEFMNNMIECIHRFPEKTYTECYQFARSAQTPEFVSYLDQNSLNFFTHHRFKNFVWNLLHAEPNYDQPRALHQPTSISPARTSSKR